MIAGAQWQALIERPVGRVHTPVTDPQIAVHVLRHAFGLSGLTVEPDTTGSEQGMWLVEVPTWAHLLLTNRVEITLTCPVGRVTIELQ